MSSTGDLPELCTWAVVLGQEHAASQHTQCRVQRQLMPNRVLLRAERLCKHGIASTNTQC
jgi:hypothetical protein